ncbi:MAG: RNA polymerase sigma factor [Planctomycetota bacterium]
MDRSEGPPDVELKRDSAGALSVEGFGALLEEHRVSLRLLAAAEVGASDAEDVVHDAAIAALERRGEFRPGTDFRAWMAAFVRYRCANHRRGERRRRDRLVRLSRREPSRSGAGDHAPGEPGPDLERAMRSLTGDQRSCLLLRVIGAHTYEEIGSILGMTPATARSHVFRSRRVLADRLTAAGETGEMGYG